MDHRVFIMATWSMALLQMRHVRSFYSLFFSFLTFYPLDLLPAARRQETKMAAGRTTHAQLHRRSLEGGEMYACAARPQPGVEGSV